MRTQIVFYNSPSGDEIDTVWSNIDDHSNLMSFITNTLRRKNSGTRDKRTRNMQANNWMIYEISQSYDYCTIRVVV